MNRTYEAMLLLDNREVRKGWQALKEQVNGVFTKHGASVTSSRRWDERRLAYPIARQLRGTYLLNYVEADTQALTAIRRDLEYSDSVLRYLIFACEDIPEGAYEPEEAFDETQVRVETEGAPAPAAEADEAASGDGEQAGAKASRGDKPAAEAGAGEDAAGGDAAVAEATGGAAGEGETGGDGEAGTEKAGTEKAGTEKADTEKKEADNV